VNILQEGIRPDPKPFQLKAQKLIENGKEATEQQKDQRFQKKKKDN
jgi:hypothetical protein